MRNISTRTGTQPALFPSQAKPTNRSYIYIYINLYSSAVSEKCFHTFTSLYTSSALSEWEMLPRNYSHSSFYWSLCTYVNASLLLACPVWQKCFNCVHPLTKAQDWTEWEEKNHQKNPQSIFTHSCPFHHAQPTEVRKKQTILKRPLRPCLTITIRVTER